MVNKHEIKLDRNQSCRDFEKKGVDGLLSTNRRIFSHKLGTLEGINAGIKIRESTTPKFCKVPFALGHKVDKNRII